MPVDHEYLSNKPKFMQKEQYNLMHSKKPMILPESMKYLNLFLYFCLLMLKLTVTKLLF